MAKKRRKTISTEWTRYDPETDIIAGAPKGAYIEMGTVGGKPAARYVYSEKALDASERKGYNREKQIDKERSARPRQRAAQKAWDKKTSGREAKSSGEGKGSYKGPPAPFPSVPEHLIQRQLEKSAYGRPGRRSRNVKSKDVETVPYEKAVRIHARAKAARRYSPIGTPFRSSAETIHIKEHARYKGFESTFKALEPFPERQAEFRKKVEAKTAQSQVKAGLNRGFKKINKGLNSIVQSTRMTGLSMAIAGPKVAGALAEFGTSLIAGSPGMISGSTTPAERFANRLGAGSQFGAGVVGAGIGAIWGPVGAMVGQAVGDAVGEIASSIIQVLYEDEKIAEKNTQAEVLRLLQTAEVQGTPITQLEGAERNSALKGLIRAILRYQYQKVQDMKRANRIMEDLNKREDTLPPEAELMVNSVYGPF